MTIITQHNYLNGFKFVTVEFGLFILFIGPYCWYYIFHKHFLLGAIALGLIANFSVVLTFAVRSMIRKEKSLGIVKLYKKQTFIDIRKKYPELSRNTTVLFFYLLVPFSIPIKVFAEYLNKK